MRESTAFYTDIDPCLVAGFGYALMSALVSYISLLVETIGPGALMCPSCPQASLFFISGTKILQELLIHLYFHTCSHHSFIIFSNAHGMDDAGV